MHQAIEAKEGRADPEREPDARHDHPAELLPAVQEARRHDRYRASPRRQRVPPRSTSSAWCRSRPTCRWSASRPVRPDLPSREEAKFNAVRRGHRRTGTTQGPAGAGRHRERWRSPRYLSTQLRKRRGVAARGAQRQAARAGGDRSSPRPGARARSPWPPTWPAAAPTSCSAATPSTSWPTCELAPARPVPAGDPGGVRGRLARAALEPRRSASVKAEEHEEVVEELGGLYVLGTERHESRRIDNQLRGRAGRQGDPGESRFYLSLGRRPDAPVQGSRPGRCGCMDRG